MRILIFVFAFSTYAAHAQYQKTCDDSARNHECTEMEANVGSAPTCTSGLPSDGRNCNRADDFGMCRWVTNVGSFQFINDHFYYHGTIMCPEEMPQPECSARLEESCIYTNEGIWVPPEET